MKILIAPDSFKESLSAEQAASAIGQGFQAIYPDAELVLVPVADGGEGTTEALVAATGGESYTDRVTGPLGTELDAVWGRLGDGETAVIESAAASGLDRVPAADRNPWLATSRGTGELIRAALDKGARHIIVGLGGSATNDAGAGLLQALGARLLDGEGQEIPQGGGGLERLARIDLEGLDPRLAETRFEVACDVDNPLTGENGASAVFGPQKGADPEMVRKLDACLANFARVVEKTNGKAINDIPGAGAAGGLGGAFLAFFDARLKPGIDIVLDAVDIDRKLDGVDLVITGEGRIDSQTVRGKTPVGVSRRARLQGIPVIALAGSVSADSDCVHDFGIDALFSIVPGIVTLPEALESASDNLFRSARNIAAVWKLAERR
ncbi:glycerate kinase [Marinobacterium nitratireducens]|uniref:Glycerate kinase n=1 Tax=Marinobacterium nitratireducens TaxID=518897 RepID=A0A917ZB30_9GAMM|nr:glycerate kinase [Marinobacterium nitratireducens]GGO79363.1 glycerate kinase [Marinobacterium nitratireducens]